MGCCRWGVEPCAGAGACVCVCGAALAQAAHVQFSNSRVVLRLAACACPGPAARPISRAQSAHTPSDAHQGDGALTAFSRTLDARRRGALAQHDGRSRSRTSRRGGAHSGQRSSGRCGGRAGGSSRAPSLSCITACMHAQARVPWCARTPLPGAGVGDGRRPDASGGRGGCSRRRSSRRGRHGHRCRARGSGAGRSGRRRRRGPAHGRAAHRAPGHRLGPAAARDGAAGESSTSLGAAHACCAAARHGRTHTGSRTARGAVHAQVDPVAPAHVRASEAGTAARRTRLAPHEEGAGYSSSS